MRGESESIDPGSGDRSPGDVELVHSIEVLADAPTAFDPGPLQKQFDSALDRAVALARTRVAQRLSISLRDEPDGVAHGTLAKFRAHEDWYDTLRDTLAHASSSASASSPAPASLNSEGGWRPATNVLLAAGPESRRLRPPLNANDLFADLDDGWMLVAENPMLADVATRDLVADLAMGYGAASPLLFYGIRSALGPPPTVSEHPRLLIQLLGRRAILFVGGEHPPQQQAQVQPGFVTLVPAGYSAAHLPLDADTAHLEIALTRMDETTPVIDEEVRSVRAMTPVVRSDHDYDATRRSLIGASDQLWTSRLWAPGGVHVTREPAESNPEPATIVVSGHQLQLSAGGIRLLEALAEGDYVTSQDLATRCELPQTRVDEALSALGKAGLLAPAPVAVGFRPNERLTQVASAVLGDPAFAEAILSHIDSDAWRPPAAGELFASDIADIAVQPFPFNDPHPILAQLHDVVATLNARFFAAELVGPHPDDPPMLVRIGSSMTTMPGADRDRALGSETLGSDLVTHSTRKVSWAFVLTDAAGGWVHLPAGSDAPTPEVGTLAAWVSSRPWQLTPCIRGERILMLGRMHGPAFT